MNLVTGATGHIGNVLVRHLLAQGKRVRALVLPGEDLAPLESLDVDVIYGDVLDPQILMSACREVDVVYHLAGVISILPGKNSYVQRVNVLGTRNMLQAAQAAGVRRLVYTSSIHAIARVPHGILINESIPYDPHTAISAYDRSKAEASLAVLQAAQAGMNAVIACPTGVIGPYDFRRSEMGHILLNSMRNKIQFCVEGAYDFVDVRDVAAGLALCAQLGRAGESYILSGHPIKMRRLMESIQQIAGQRARLLAIPGRLAHWIASCTPLYYHLTRTRPLFTPYALATVTSNSNISCAKAQNELGYHRRPPLETLTDAVQWFQAQFFSSHPIRHPAR